MPKINVKVPGGEPIFDLTSYGRKGPEHRDRLSPADIALISHTVHGSAEVMVRVLTRGSTAPAALANHVSYIARGGALALETDESEQLKQSNLADVLFEQWNLDLEQHRRSSVLVAGEGRKPAKMVHKLVLSMPAGTPPEGLVHASRHFLREEFANKHRYAFVLHTDVPHPHVHVILKAVGEQGMRLRIDKRTLRRWRQQFATHLRAEGIAANATDRAVRGKSCSTKHDGIFRAARRGESTHLNRRVQQVLGELSHGGIVAEPGKARLLNTRHKVAAGWLAVSRVLMAQGQTTLAEDIRRFIQRLPSVRTEKEQLLQQLQSRAPAIGSNPPLTRERSD